MKIGFLCHNIFDDGGVQRVITTLCNGLCHHHDVEIICTNVDISIDYQKYKLNADKVNVVYKKLSNNNLKNCFLKAFRGLNKFSGIFNNKYCIEFLKNIYYPKFEQDDLIEFINNQNYDVIIGSEGYLSIFLGVIKESLNCKVIGWQHNSVDAYFKTEHKYCWNKNFLFEKYIKKLDEYIVLTKSDKKNLFEQFNINSKVIYNPISFKTKNKSLCTKKNIIAIGRLTSQKGFDNLLKSFKLMCDEVDDWRLKIVGDGEDRSNLMKLAQELKIEHRVEFLPFTSDIEGLLRESSLYAMSSRWEGFGLVVTEALELGVPVISFDTSGPFEILSNHECGVIVKNNDVKSFSRGLIDLALNEEKRKKYSRNAIKRAKDFYEENILYEWEKILK